MKKTIEGNLFNRIEKLGGKEYRHIGFEDKNNAFGDLMESMVSKSGMNKKARLTIELLPDKSEKQTK